MTQPHLILHKVRGEPAFDIAEPMEVDNEIIWIIQTSGHRAYPYGTWKLDGLGQGSDYGFPAFAAPTPPEGWPDHYSANSSPKPSTFSPTSLLTRLGLMPKINRRF